MMESGFEYHSFGQPVETVTRNSGQTIPKVSEAVSALKAPLSLVTSFGCSQGAVDFAKYSVCAAKKSAASQLPVGRISPRLSSLVTRQGTVVLYSFSPVLYRSQLYLTSFIS